MRMTTRTSTRTMTKKTPRTKCQWMVGLPHPHFYKAQSKQLTCAAHHCPASPAVSSPSNPPARHASSSPPPPPLKLVDYDDDDDDDMDPFWSGKGKSAAAAAHRASAGGKPPGSSNGGGISFALGERRPASPSGTAAGTTLNGRAEQQQSSPQQPSVKKVKLEEGPGSP